MSKNHFILISGVWIALVPFLGFPSGTKTFLVAFSGLLVVLLSILVSRDRRRVPLMHIHKSIETDVYVENRALPENSEQG